AAALVRQSRRESVPLTRIDVLERMRSVLLHGGGVQPPVETRRGFIRSNQYHFALSRAVPRKRALEGIPPSRDQALPLGSTQARFKSCAARPCGGNGGQIGKYPEREPGQKGSAL